MNPLTHLVKVIADMTISLELLTIICSVPMPLWE